MIRNIIFLLTNNPEAFALVYKKLSDEFINREEISEIKKLHDALHEVMNELTKSVDESLLRSDYLITRCKYCPSSLKRAS